MSYSAVDTNGFDDGPQDELGQIRVKINQTTDEVSRQSIQL